MVSKKSSCVNLTLVFKKLGLKKKDKLKVQILFLFALLCFIPEMVLLVRQKQKQTWFCHWIGWIEVDKFWYWPFFFLLSFSSFK